MNKIGKEILTGLLLALILFEARGGCHPSPSESKGDGATEAARVLRLFEGKSAQEVMRDLDGIRPEPVGEGEKRALLADFPHTDARMNKIYRRREEQLRPRVEPALKLHRRSAVIELKVFEHQYPVILTKPGAIIAVSLRLLELVGGDDGALIGIISHELAHEYVAMSFYEASRLRQHARLRELELFCDAVAVASLVALNVDPARYAKILQKVVSSSPESMLLNDGSAAMPSLDARLKLIAGLGASLAVTSGARVGAVECERRSHHSNVVMRAEWSTLERGTVLKSVVLHKLI